MQEGRLGKGSGNRRNVSMTLTAAWTLLTPTFAVSTLKTNHRISSPSTHSQTTAISTLLVTKLLPLLPRPRPVPLPHPPSACRSTSSPRLRRRSFPRLSNRNKAHQNRARTRWPSSTRLKPRSQASNSSSPRDRIKPAACLARLPPLLGTRSLAHLHPPAIPGSARESRCQSLLQSHLRKPTQPKARTRPIARARHAIHSRIWPTGSVTCDQCNGCISYRFPQKPQLQAGFITWSDDSVKGQTFGLECRKEFLSLGIAHYPDRPCDVDIRRMPRRIRTKTFALR